MPGRVAETPAELDDDDLIRHSRQIILSEVGGSGQMRLHHARVAVVGAGGLGGPVLLYLVAAGVGHITVIDDDLVALDNLGRQVLFTSADVGRPKSDVAQERLRALDPSVVVESRRLRLTPTNADALLRGHDVAVDASDGLVTKFAVNDAAVALGITCVVGGVLRWEGQVVTVPPGAPCYRCLFGAPPSAEMPTCRAAGVAGPVAGVVGSLQAAEVLRALLGAGAPQGGRILVHDGLRGGTRSVPFPADPGCTACRAGVAG